MLIAAVIAVLIGAVVRGFSGFGSSMFWVLSLSLLYPPSSVVPSVLAMEVLASLLLLPAIAGKVEWQTMRWMFAATVMTMPLGVLLLALLPAQSMRLVVAVAILVATTAMAFGIDIAGTPGVRTALRAGSVSGLINGSTGIGGPPAVLMYFSQKTPTQAGRATLIAYFLGADTIGFIYMAAYGLVDGQVLVHTGALSPIALIGLLLGHQGFRRYGDVGFRTAMLVILFLLSFVMLARALV